MAENRLDYIDIAKGLGMFTIIWGHIMYAGISDAIVYAFHIPLFFFLSGLVFSRNRYQNFSTFLVKRIKGLIVPYFVFSFLTWIIWALYSWLGHAQVESYWMPLLQTFIAQGSDGYLIHNVPLWFVWCLFVVEIGYYFISNLSDWVIIVICLGCAALGYILVNHVDAFDFTRLPWSIEVALMAIPFYALGNLINKNIGHQQLVDTINKNKVVSWLVILACLIALYFGASFNGSASMGHAYLGKNVWIFYPTAICGIVAMMGLCVLLSQSVCNKKNHWSLKYVKWFGKNSFRVMAIHNPIKGFIVVMVAHFLNVTTHQVNANGIYALIAFVPTVIVTSVLVWMIGWFLNKTLKRNSLLK